MKKIFFVLGFELGRPFIGPPAMPQDRLQTLREALARTMKDSALLAAAQKKKWDLDHLGGAELEVVAKEVMIQPAEVIERIKNFLAQE
jgi:tripartite-type tricarboxylate transporter receptor subunit TctC